MNLARSIESASEKPLGGFLGGIREASARESKQYFFEVRAVEYLLWNHG